VKSSRIWHRLLRLAGLVVMLAIVVVIMAASMAAVKNRRYDEAAKMVGGDAERGRAAIELHGCGSCHFIPGIPGARALVAAPLTHMRSRSFVGGVVQNTPQNIIKWIVNPKAVDPMTAMPNLGVSEKDSQDIATYLYSLQ